MSKSEIQPIGKSIKFNETLTIFNEHSMISNRENRSEIAPKKSALRRKSQITEFVFIEPIIEVADNQAKEKQIVVQDQDKPIEALETD